MASVRTVGGRVNAFLTRVAEAMANERCVLDAAPALLSVNSRRSRSSHDHEPDPFRKRRPLAVHQFERSSIAHTIIESTARVITMVVYNVRTVYTVVYIQALKPQALQPEIYKLDHDACRCLERCSSKQASTRSLGYLGAAGN